ncbi:hypothetical protein EVAR_47527_1 [Eumeta japonica]|uniref:Uncharacterized protein n=1 Tax=Eumeta variegata TaxID=151549 RepID=A0A4C1XUY3_EUMVA|nr:hypothetical protein EVAR_47527_1 [Eumeta japonica]
MNAGPADKNQHFKKCTLHTTTRNDVCLLELTRHQLRERSAFSGEGPCHTAPPRITLYLLVWRRLKFA